MIANTQPTQLLCAAGGVTSFKATDKKVVNKSQPNNQQQQDGQPEEEAEQVPWHRMRNLGDMEGTWDAWVLLLSFSLSLITAIVGVFQMIDKPYTAQVRGGNIHLAGACILRWWC